ncbi:Lrp/AsnC family transcriptional regulator [Actinomadura syzygii]|uniref:Lrp/AsnC family transcriptional regulator n=1 Tax=Actinomadura syzygii TaxID=1427538 RepID=A0A5D0U7Q2_9ACTN|nr:Lrp/AsnC family transcriptional regulator [Actinomadura syzygii]
MPEVVGVEVNRLLEPRRQRRGGGGLARTRRSGQDHDVASHSPDATGGRYAERVGGKERAGDGARAGQATPSMAALDSTDREILRILQKDGRTSNSAIARTLGITETTVRKRIAAMRERDLMEIVAVPTPRLAGYNISAIIGLSVSLPYLREVSQALVGAPEVRYCGLSTGRFDVMIEAFFYDKEHLLRFTTDVLGALPGITAVETSLILKIEKFSYEWELG